MINLVKIEDDELTSSIMKSKKVNFEKLIFENK